MFEMRFCHGFALAGDSRNYFPFVVGFCFSFFDANGALGTIAQARSKAVAEEIADQARFSFDHLQGALGAAGHAKPATRAFFFIDLNDFPFHTASSLSFSMARIARAGGRFLDPDQEAAKIIVQLQKGTGPDYAAHHLVDTAGYSAFRQFFFASCS
jgi:hypothetical protein